MTRASYLIYFKKFVEAIPEDHLSSSATLTILKNSPKLTEEIFKLIDSNLNIRSCILDLGCGYGYLALLFKDVLNFEKIYGVDINNERLEIAKGFGIITCCLDLENAALPFPDGSFDLVIASGIFNHLKFWDNALQEVRRVLKAGGLFIVSNPNLGSWINRLSLLLGYQPPDIEVSKIYTINLPPFYPRKRSIESVHSLTLRGLIQLLRIYNFIIIKVFTAGIFKNDLDQKKPPIPKILKYLIMIIDRITSLFPSLSIRIIIVSKKAEYSNF